MTVLEEIVTVMKQPNGVYEGLLNVNPEMREADIWSLAKALIGLGAQLEVCAIGL